MKDIFIVKPEQLDLARKVENILLSLSEDIGIIFASANIKPNFILDVLIGCKKEIDKNLIEYIAKYYLREEMPQDIKLIIKVRCGIIKS